MKYLLSAFVFVCLGCLVVWATGGPKIDLPLAEQELVDLMNEYYVQLEGYWSDRQEYEDREDRKSAIADGRLIDPNAEFISRLLDFEKEHRGKEVGLQALRHVISEAERGGAVDSPTNMGRRKAYLQLPKYAKYDLMPRTIGSASYGNYEPTFEIAAQAIIDSDKATPLVRESTRFFLGKWWIDSNSNLRSIGKRMSDLADGAKPRWDGEVERLRKDAKSYPDEESLAKKAEEAIVVLEELAADKSSPRIPKIVGVDPKWRIVRAVEDESQPLLSTKVAAFLFKERHLKVGAMAPPVAVTLVGGEPWSLVDQRGRVVVIQFSFTGCGPCARMYPGLKEMTESYPDSLSVLTLLRDETPGTAIKGISDGKFTWSIALDGKPGRIAAKWSVDGFPSVYVIDREGRIAASDVGENSWRAAVEKLLEGGE